MLVFGVFFVIFLVARPGWTLKSQTTPSDLVLVEFFFCFLGWPPLKYFMRRPDERDGSGMGNGGWGMVREMGTSISHLLFINFTRRPINTKRKKGEPKCRPDLLFGFKKRLHAEKIWCVIIILFLLLYLYYFSSINVLFLLFYFLL